MSTADILGGALRGSLDLAAAGGLDLAKSAEIAAQAMNLFNLEGSDVSHIADVLTAAANKSAAGVDDLGMALSQCGTVAAATGLTIEETTGTLAAFADSGMKGSDAGTSFKAMLQRLNPTSKEAASTMERLGISAYDAQGNFVRMESLAGQLQTSMAGLTAEQRNSAMATMFGSDAVRAANIIYGQGEAGIREYVAAVNDQGAAQRMESLMTDNLKGDWEELTGAIETALIKTGSGGAEALRGWVEGLEGVVAWYNQLDAGTQSAVLNVAALSAAILDRGGLGQGPDVDDGPVGVLADKRPGGFMFLCGSGGGRNRPRRRRRRVLLHGGDERPSSPRVKV
ncbi:phage tail tape measure protein [Janibacter sp. YIM B02568]|nr:phage tail tape measure protein [Janibacter endophyticus]